MAASLAAVAVGVGNISSHSKELAESGNGMDQLVSVAKKSSKAFLGMVKSISVVSSALSMLSKTASSTVSSIRSYYTSFYSAGAYVVQGFADGIRDNRYMAELQSRAMARNAAIAAKNELKINSPSKVFRALAYSIPEGFAQGIERRSWMGRDAAISMADETLRSTSKAIAKVSNLISSDIDTQPTIRPVVDLSNVESSVGMMSNMLNMNPSVGVMSNISAISSTMNSRQNGALDVVSAIKDIGKKLGSSGGDTYQINGITYDDGSNIAEAVKTLVRATKIERRR